MAQFKTISLADQVFEKLEDDIIFGVYPRGELLTELMLAEKLGVSRTPIREALRRLTQERLITETSRGSMVVGISPADLQDIMDIRLRVEGLAAYYCTKNILPQELEELRHTVDLQEFYASKGDIDHVQITDSNFHGLICKYSGHAVIEETLVPLHRKTQRYRKVSIADPNRTAHIPAEHRKIFDAIAAGDAELAEKLTKEHIEHAKKNIMERIRFHGNDDFPENY
ncbi:MAG: GntR family transcriptional regulator [Oscillospiraceae bacterium]|nr:GntR family transcriptional regulator [Oscillospiraceae bacterium]